MPSYLIGFESFSLIMKMLGKVFTLYFATNPCSSDLTSPKSKVFYGNGIKRENVDYIKVRTECFINEWYSFLISE